MINNDEINVDCLNFQLFLQGNRYESVIVRWNRWVIIIKPVIQEFRFNFAGRRRVRVVIAPECLCCCLITIPWNSSVCDILMIKCGSLIYAVFYLYTRHKTKERPWLAVDFCTSIEMFWFWFFFFKFTMSLTWLWRDAICYYVTHGYFYNLYSRAYTWWEYNINS